MVNLKSAGVMGRRTSSRLSKDRAEQSLQATLPDDGKEREYQEKEQRVKTEWKRTSRLSVPGSGSKRVRASVEDHMASQGVGSQQEFEEECIYSSQRAIAMSDDDEGGQDVQSQSTPKKKKRKGMKAKSYEVQTIVDRAYKRIDSDLLEKIHVGLENISSNDIDLGVSQAMIKPLVATVMRYVLFLNLTNSPCTMEKIQKNAIVPYIGGTLGTHHKRLLMHIVMVQFHSVFGYDLVSLADAPTLDKDAKAKKNASTKDQWFLLNMMISEPEKKRLWMDREDNHKRGMIMVILACVMLNENAISEVNLLRIMHDELGLLQKISKTSSAKAEGTFPYAEDLLKEFVSESYLTYQRTGEKDDNGNAVYRYKFGPRAMIEIGIPNILRFVKQVAGVELTVEDSNQLIFGS